MSDDGHNSISLDAFWMDMLRSLAILAVVIHHWLLFNPYSSSVRIFTNIADLIQTLAGTVVHLFFILSGCGLTVSYFRKGFVSEGSTPRLPARRAYSSERGKGED